MLEGRASITPIITSIKNLLAVAQEVGEEAKVRYCVLPPYYFILPT